MAKHNHETAEQGNGLAPTVYQFQKGRVKRITSHIGTLKIKTGGETVTFTPEQLKGEAYIDLDYQGNPIKDQNGMGFRFAMAKMLPYPAVGKPVEGGGSTEFTSKEEFLQSLSDLYDDVSAYNNADQVQSVNGQATGSKAFPTLCEGGETVASLLIGSIAYGLGLHYQNTLMRKAMTVVAEETLRQENGLAAPAPKVKAAKRVEGDDSDNQV